MADDFDELPDEIAEAFGIRNPASRSGPGREGPT